MHQRHYIPNRLFEAYLQVPVLQRLLVLVVQPIDSLLWSTYIASDQCKPLRSLPFGGLMIHSYIDVNDIMLQSYDLLSKTLRLLSTNTKEPRKAFSRFEQLFTIRCPAARTPDRLA